MKIWRIMGDAPMLAIFQNLLYGQRNFDKFQRPHSFSSARHAGQKLDQSSDTLQLSLFFFTAISKLLSEKLWLLSGSIVQHVNQPQA
jgi:hypothetical protein